MAAQSDLAKGNKDIEIVEEEEGYDNRVAQEHTRHACGGDGGF